MITIKPAIVVNNPSNEVVKKDLHQEDTLLETVSTSTDSNNVSSISDSSAGEIGSSSIFSEDNGTAVSSYVKSTTSTVSELNSIVSASSDTTTNLGKVSGVNDAINTLEQSMGSTGALSSLSDEQKATMTAISQSSSDLTGDLIVLNNERISLTSGDAQSIASITKSLNALGGTQFDLIDLGSELAFISMVTSYALAWGIPDIIDAAIEHMDDEEEKEKQQLLALMNASKAGSVSQTIYWKAKVDSSEVRDNAEEIIENLLRYYKRVTDESLVVGGEGLVSLLDDLDSSWDAGVTLEPYMDACDSALEAIEYTDRGKYASIQLQMNFRVVSCNTIINTSFPDLDPSSEYF